MELQMTTEIEALFAHLDKMRMTPAERDLAKARLAQADALAAALLAAVAAVKKLFPAHKGQDLSAPEAL
jgi:hypothetical protein